MSHLLLFRSSPLSGSSIAEANIFVHGYSAGQNDEDKQSLLGIIPDHPNKYANIFAFKPSNHIFHFEKSSLRSIGISDLSLVKPAPSFIMKTFFSGKLPIDRLNNFSQVRVREERMDEVLFEQLQDHLHRNHPKIDTINLISHSPVGRLLISSFKNHLCRSLLSIKNVFLMAVAVEVNSEEVRKLNQENNVRIINAHSKKTKFYYLNLVKPVFCAMR